MSKLSAIPRGALRGVLWLAVLSVILSISAYSLYFVARHLGVPRLFAIGMSTAYDGTALLAADKSLQYAQEGRSGSVPRLEMVVFAGLSAWLNALHSILGHESPLAIPMWAGLPIAAAAVFELHTSQARARAMARQGKRYPAPLPSWGGVTWMLFPLKTLKDLRGYVSSRASGLAKAQGAILAAESAVPKPANRPLTGPKPKPATNDPAKINEPANRTANETPNEPANANAGQDAEIIDINRESPRDIRAWARANDIRKPNGESLSDRARIPESVKQAYRAANGGGG